MSFTCNTVTTARTSVQWRLAMVFILLIQLFVGMSPMLSEVLSLLYLFLFVKAFTVFCWHKWRSWNISNFNQYIHVSSFFFGTSTFEYYFSSSISLRQCIGMAMLRINKWYLKHSFIMTHILNRQYNFSPPIHIDKIHCRVACVSYTSTSCDVPMTLTYSYVTRMELWMTTMTSSGFVITGLIFIGCLCACTLTTVLFSFRFRAFTVQRRVFPLSPISLYSFHWSTQESVCLVECQKNCTQAGPNVPRCSSI